MTTTRSPDSSSSGDCTPVRANEPRRTGSSPVTSYRTSVLSSSTRTRSRPSVLTMSGSSTPASCTLVPVVLEVASLGWGVTGTDPGAGTGTLPPASEAS